MSSSVPLILSSKCLFVTSLGKWICLFLQLFKPLFEKQVCDYLLVVTIIVIDIFCQITLKIDFYFERLVFISLF